MLTSDGRDKRKQYDFRFHYIYEDEQNILRDVNQLGNHNFVETTMSLRSIEIKKSLEIVTREYTVNNMIRCVYEFMNGEIINYFLKAQGDIGKLILAINQNLTRILAGKECKVWIRDIMNNYLWTYSLEN